MADDDPRPLSDEERAAIARAEAALAGLADQYLAAVAADIARLKAAAAELVGETQGRAACLERLFTIAHDMKGQGATFGYPLVTEVGNRLCRFIEARRSDLDTAAVTVILHHVDALDRIIGERMEGAARPEAADLIKGLD